MTVQIRFGNAVSHVVASPQLIRELKPLVAWQERVLPSVPAQRVLKSALFASRWWWRNPERLLDAVYGDASKAADLEAAGCPREFVTREILQALSRQKGYWDGWRSMIGSDGAFLSGLLRHVERALRMRLGQLVAVSDARDAPETAPAFGRPVPLYPYQEEAVNGILGPANGIQGSDPLSRFNFGRGVIDLPPRSGKTRVAAAIIGRLGLPTLYVVPTVGLVEQTVAALTEFLPREHVMGVTGGEPAARERRLLNRALVWVVTAPTAAGKQDAGMGGILSRRVLVIDERHHDSASTWQAINLATVNAYYRIGLTGTHYRADGTDLVMRGVLGNVAYRRTVHEMIELCRLVPARIAMVRLEREVYAKDWRAAYRAGVTECDERNRIAAAAARKLVACGRRVLVLTKEIEHARTLSALVPGSVQVDGDDNEQASAALRALQAGTLRCVVGTPVIGEGRDIPFADALVYAAGGRSRVKVKQDTYRVLTAATGKRQAIIVDFADNHHAGLLSSAVERLAQYRAEPDFLAVAMDAEALDRTLADWTTER